MSEVVSGNGQPWSVRYYFALRQLPILASNLKHDLFIDDKQRAGRGILSCYELVFYSLSPWEELPFARVRRTRTISQTTDSAISSAVSASICIREVTSDRYSIVYDDVETDHGA